MFTRPDCFNISAGREEEHVCTRISEASLSPAPQPPSSQCLVTIVTRSQRHQAHIVSNVCGGEGGENTHVSGTLTGIGHQPQLVTPFPSHHTTVEQGCPSERKSTDLGFRCQSRRSDPNSLEPQAHWGSAIIPWPQGGWGEG